MTLVGLELDVGANRLGLIVRNDQANIGEFGRRDLPVRL